MYRRSRSDISKGHHGIVPIDNIRGNFSLDNAAKEAITHRTLLKNSRYESEINRRRSRPAAVHRPVRFQSLSARFEETAPHRDPKYIRRSAARTQHHEWHT